MRGRPKKGSQRVPSQTKKKSRKPDQFVKSEDHLAREADFAALDEFCRQPFDDGDLSFDHWEKVHTDLDVQVPVWLNAEALGQDRSMIIKFTRRILSSVENGILKEGAEIHLDIPAEARHGERFRLPSLGDRQGQNRGDLIIILYFRHPTSSS